MYRIHFTALILLQLLCLQVELSAQSQSKKTKPRGSIVSGRVTFKGKPVNRVTVSIRPEGLTGPQNPNSIRRTRTDQNGKYRIAGVAAGRYKISASAPGFGLMTDGPDTVPNLKVNDGENVGNIDFELKRGGVITGRVTNSNKHPLVGERVGLMRLIEDGRAAPLFILHPEMGTTDDRGIYRFYGVPTGRYLVNVGVSPAGGVPSLRPSRSNFPRTFFSGVSQQSEANVIEVREGSEAKGIDIVATEPKKTYSIYGRVVSAESGQPVPGVELHCGYLSEERRGIRGITNWGPPGIRSDAKGEFRVPGLLPGKLMLFARLDRESEVFSEFEVCEIGDNDIRGIEIKVRRGGSISGVITVEGTNDQDVLSKVPELQLSAVVITKQLSPPGMEFARASADGSFRIKGLRPGKVHISMSQQPTSRQFSILRIEHNGEPISQNEGIEVGPGEDISDLRVIVGYAGSAIQGEVKIVGGTLPVNQILYVNARYLGAQQGIPALAQADARHQFVFENLLPGEYELYLSPLGPQVDSRLSTAISKARQKVVVGPNSRPVVLLEINLAQKEDHR